MFIILPLIWSYQPDKSKLLKIDFCKKKSFIGVPSNSQPTKLLYAMHAHPHLNACTNIHMQAHVHAYTKVDRYTHTDS